MGQEDSKSEGGMKSELSESSTREELIEDKKASQSTGAKQRPVWLPPPLAPREGTQVRQHSAASRKASTPGKVAEGSLDAVQIDLGNLCGFDPGADLGPMPSNTSDAAYKDSVRARAKLVLAALLEQVQSQDAVSRKPDGALEVACLPFLRRA
jgi:hypothetical protein